MALVGDNIKQEDNRRLLSNPNVRAMLNTIGYAEGADYNTIVGGKTFSSFDKKPRNKVYIKNIKDYSTAEGKYQFLNSTWDEIAKDLSLKDFSPESQDLAAVELIKRKGALDDIINGNFESAVHKLSGTWASLPTVGGSSAYRGQNARNMSDLKSFYYNIDTQNKSFSPEYEYSDINIPTDYNVFKNIQQSSYNLPTNEEAGVKQEDEKVVEAKRILNEKTLEQQILDSYNKQNKQQEQTQQEEVVPYADIQQQYAAVSNFVDTPLYQEGGILDKLTSKLSNLFSSDEPINNNQEKITPKTIFIKDDRTTSATTGKKINPNKELVSGEYNINNIRSIINAAKRQGVDPYTALAISLQETGLGKTDGNLGHVIDSDYVGRPSDKLAYALKTKLETADRLGLTDEAKRLQIYNGNKKIFPSTEERYHGFKMKSIYGVPIPEGGLDMGQNPLYGKRVIDLRDNVLKKNKFINDEVSRLSPNYNKFFRRYDEPLLSYMSNTTLQEGGDVLNRLMVSKKGVFDSNDNPVIVPAPNISMKGVNYPIQATSLETGETKLLQPNEEYLFKNTKNVLEIPQLNKYFNKKG